MPRFLFVGRNWKIKNGDAVVRALVEARKHEPRASLDVVGRHLPLSVDGVTGHGELSRHDPDERTRLDRLFARASCFVMPSLVEPFGHVYVEAAAAGIPSIATTVGGTAESVGPGGILVDPLDEAALVNAMVRMCDATAVASLGTLARQHAKLLTWDAVTQRIVRALDLEVPGVELADFL